MRKVLVTIILAGLCSIGANAQLGKIKLDKAVDAATKGVKSFTLSDAEVIEYTNEYMQWMDKNNQVYGYEFLKHCGKDPANIASALGVLLKLQEEAGSAENSKFNKLFSNHPDLKKRIETLNKKKK
jgi:phosphoglycerate-specific signal transduction histidine kinase